MNMENSVRKYKTIDGKELSKEGFIAAIRSKTYELRPLRTEVQEASMKPGFPSAELKKKVVNALSAISSEYYEESEADKYELDVHEPKAALKRQVEDLKNECMISKEDSDANNREVIDMSRFVQKKEIEKKPILEITRPTTEEIEAQEAAILDIVHDYEVEIEGTLEVMRKRYDDENDQRLKGLLKKELFMVQSDILSRIEKDIENTEDSEYLQIAGAKADLVEVKNKILKMTDGVAPEEAIAA